MGGRITAFMHRRGCTSAADTNPPILLWSLDPAPYIQRHPVVVFPRASYMIEKIGAFQHPWSAVPFGGFSDWPMLRASNPRIDVACTRVR